MRPSKKVSAHRCQRQVPRGFIRGTPLRASPVQTRPSENSIIPCRRDAQRNVSKELASNSHTVDKRDRAMGHHEERSRVHRVAGGRSRGSAAHDTTHRRASRDGNTAPPEHARQEPSRQQPEQKQLEGAGEQESKAQRQHDAQRPTA